MAWVYLLKCSTAGIWLSGNTLALHTQGSGLFPSSAKKKKNLKCSRAATQYRNKRSFEEQLNNQMKQPCPSNHILPVACGKGVVFVLSSEHMQNRSVCVSINKRTLYVCLAPGMARAVDCFWKFCSNSRVSRIYKY